MDSGKEYETEFFKSIKDLVDSCYKTTEIPNPFGKSNSVTKFSNGFSQISEKIAISKEHISSVEEI